MREQPVDVDSLALQLRHEPFLLGGIGSIGIGLAVLDQIADARHHRQVAELLPGELLEGIVEGDRLLG